LEGNLREFSEVIRIKKTVSGSYLFYITDWWIGPISRLRAIVSRSVANKAI